MKLQVAFEMQLPEGYEPYLEIIAKTHGWSEGLGVTATSYVCQSVCEKQVSALFSSIISGALSAYYGLSGAAQVDAIIEQYQQGHAVAANLAE
jgi:hypothetical protein